jgi:hypothetical protein
VFDAALGLGERDAPRLEAALLEAARTMEVQLGDADEYGQRFLLDFLMEGPRAPVKVRSCWILQAGEEAPRLTTCYAL